MSGFTSILSETGIDMVVYGDIEKSCGLTDSQFGVTIAVSFVFLGEKGNVGENSRHSIVIARNRKSVGTQIKFKSHMCHQIASSGNCHIVASAEIQWTRESLLKFLLGEIRMTLKD
jgi:galactokinase